MTNRQEIVQRVQAQLETISGFDEVTYWRDTPGEYSNNLLNFLDTEENYQPENKVYDASLLITVEAVVIETSTNKAAVLGNLVLTQLITAINNLAVCGIVKLVRSRKFVETKGKTACLVELDFMVSYKFDR